MRHRRSGDLHNLGLVETVTTINPYDYPFVNMFGFSEKSEMWDETQDTHSGKRYGFALQDHTCLHRKLLVDSNTVWPHVHHPWYAYPVDIDVVMSPREFVMPDVDFPEIPDVRADFDAFLRRSAKSFQQQFESKVSIANFIYELKDFKDIYSKFQQLALGCQAKKAYATAKAVSKDEINGRMRSGVGGNYLDYVFNWQSLARDLPKCFSFYGEAMERLKFLAGYATFTDHRRIKFQIEPFTRGFNAIYDYDFVPPTGYVGAQLRLQVLPVVCQVTFNANAYVDNKLHMEAINYMDVIADQLGLNNSPKILWNATKLSWLVDFFLDSRDFFDAFEKQALNGFLAVNGGTCSKKIEMVYNINCQYSTASGLADRDLGTLTYTYYERTPLRLVKTGLFALNTTLTDDQTLILGALIDSGTGVSSKSASALVDLALSFRKRFRSVRKGWKSKRGAFL